MSRVIAVWSPGGAGATTLTLALGVAAAQRRLQPLLADLNLGQPDIALRLGLLREEHPLAPCLTHLLPDLTGRRLNPETLHQCLRRPPRFPGLAVLPGVLRPLDGSRVSEEHLLQLLSHLRRESPLVLLDTAPALDSLGTFTALQAAEAIYLVIDATERSRFHLARHLPLLPELGIPPRRLHLVINGPRKGDMHQELDLEPIALLPPGLDPLALPPAAAVLHLLDHAVGGEANACR